MAISYTSVGEAEVVDRIDGTQTATDFFIGWGTGGSGTGSTATKADTALEAEATEVRGTAVASQPAADKNQWVATITETTGKTIEEVGLFTLATVGVMIIRATHAAVTLATGDAIQYTFSLEQT